MQVLQFCCRRRRLSAREAAARSTPSQLPGTATGGVGLWQQHLFHQPSLHFWWSVPSRPLQAAGAPHLALPSQAQLHACWVGSLRATMPTSSDVLRTRAAQLCAKRLAVGAHMAYMSGGQLAAVVVARLVAQAHQPMLVRWRLPVMTRAIATLTKKGGSSLHDVQWLRRLAPPSAA